MVSLGHLEVSLPIQTLDFNTGENQIHSYIGTDDSDEFRYNVQIDVEKGCRISIKILPLRSSRNDGTIKTFVKQVVKVNPTMNTGNTNPNTNATISKPPIISTNTFNQSSSISTNTSTITTNTLPLPTPDSVRKAKQPMVMVRKLPEAKSKAPPEQPEQQAKQQEPEQQPPELEVEDIKDFAMPPDVDDSYEADDTTLQTDGNASGVGETIAVQGSDTDLIMGCETVEWGDQIQSYNTEIEVNTNDIVDYDTNMETEKDTPQRPVRHGKKRHPVLHCDTVVSNIPKTFYFTVDEDEWNGLRNEQGQKTVLPKRWTGIFVDYIKKACSDLLCNVIFVRHRAKLIDSRKRVGKILNAQGLCTTPGCPLEFDMLMPRDDRVVKVKIREGNIYKERHTKAKEEYDKKKKYIREVNGL